MESQRAFGRSFSFEFFPPKTSDGITNLAQARARLAALGPDFVSVTFGAGGSTREGTLETVRACRADGLVVAPHLSCIGSTRESIDELLVAYRAEGVTRIVALYIPLALLGKALFGIAGIFAAYTIANIASGVLGYFWARRNAHRLCEITDPASVRTSTQTSAN